MDELTQLRKQNRELSDKLGRQIAAWNANGDALTAHAERQAQRIAELEATVAQLTAQLAAVPVDALRRYYRGTVYTPTAAQRYDYMPDDYDTDSIAIYRWLFPKENGA